jgi:hypothetical protein
VIEAVGEPAGREQRSAEPADDRGVRVGVPRDHGEDREREILDVPGVVVRGGQVVGFQQR